MRDRVWDPKKSTGKGRTKSWRTRTFVYKRLGKMICKSMHFRHSMHRLSELKSLALITFIVSAALIPVSIASASAAPGPTLIAERPHYVLEAGDLTLFIVDPLTPDSYYTGQRFASSAMVAQALWKGQPILAEWTENGITSTHDHVGGTAEEFDINGPASFPAESSDGPFLKIGVGLLRKSPEQAQEPYRFFQIYERIASPAFRIHQTNPREIIFEENLNDSLTGLGYTLKSTVSIHEDSQGFTIHRELTNLGRETLRTEHYSHNFLRVGDRPIGSDYRVEWNQAIPLESEKTPDEATQLTPTSLSFEQGVIENGIYFFSELEKNLQLEMYFALEVKDAGLRLEIKPSRPVTRVAIWGGPKVICPEPFVLIEVQPGETEKWSTGYELKDVAQAN